MNVKGRTIKLAVSLFWVAAFAAAFSLSFANQTPAQQQASAEQHYVPHYTKSGEMILPPNNLWRQWVFVGAPFTPNALNGGNASFPEYHNVYIQPWAYAEYKETGQFPDGTIMFKELQLTLPPSQFKDGSRIEPSGRGYFPGAYNGADVSVKDSKRYAATDNWAYFDFNHHEPKAPMTKEQPPSECQSCHIANAKKDEVWTQFYRLLDQ